MWKRIMAIFLVLILCVSVMWVANPIAPVTKVSADTYRSGFSIVPEKAGVTKTVRSVFALFLYFTVFL